MTSIVRGLVESSLNINKIATSLKIKLGASLSSRSVRWEVAGEINKLIALIQASARFDNRVSSDYKTTKDLGLLKKLIKKDLSKLGSLNSKDLGFLIVRLENLAVLLNR